MSELGQATVAAARAREAQQSARERRAYGVVHTPIELARWGVRRVDSLLRESLGLARGLADPHALVLDPAVGTGVWLGACLEHTRAARARRRMLGFDLDAKALKSARAILDAPARAQNVTLELVRENTLSLADPWPAGDAVRVIVGNPPWAARSHSRGTALSDRWLAEFQHDADGAPLAERRMGVLSDDYVRFWRWALEQVRQAQRGAVVCLATNASFLDGPVHRGMRAALSSAFDRIEVLDLGGNSLLSRARERDENLFGVRVGAALCVAIKRAESRTGRAAVSYARMQGARADKLASLALGQPPGARALVPEAPWYRFVPAPAAPVLRGFGVDEAFPFHREGVQTNRDEVATARTRAELQARLCAIAEGRLALVPARHFDPVAVRRVLSRALAHDAEACITELLYRPLDLRVVCTVAGLCHRPRPELRAAMGRSSLGLLAARKDRGAAPFSLFGAARVLTDACFLSTRSSCRTRLFPSHTSDGDENLAPALRERFTRLLRRDAGVLEVMAYSLGVLAAPTFRARHGEALKLDYPRVPWPGSAEAFEQLARCGREFIAASCDAQPAPPTLLLTPLDPQLEVAWSALRFDPVRRELWTGAHRLACGLSPAAWQLEIGHHGLVGSALRANASCRRLFEALERAQALAQATEAADQGYVRCLT